ncbi:hypothetical protein TI39_contig402g00016 [Zymoseptoria brevis]|uniref:Uncharacterized protein n=1 Tax=Zymoseptoria brevis TaxID=1047168 RepID=A0A0F4GNF9_9PEZI|nr:hypothetical protein TI39_contig402g00016 [Zymoseptoria brevis]
MSDYEEEDEFGVDPAIAAAMGFTGFGAKPSKKRKFDRNDGFVDPSISATSSGPQGKGANNTPMGERKSVNSKTPLPGSVVGVDAAENGGAQVPIRSQPHSDGNAESGATSMTAASAGPPSLEALRWGVKNDRGDLVVFMPSFLEDPWARLRAS